MRSEQSAELIRRHPNSGEDVAHGSLGYVAARVNWHADRAAIGMSHEVVAALNARDREPGALQGLDYLRSWYHRDAARHDPARYYESCHVECHSEFVRYADLFEQEFKALAQIGYRGLLCWPVPKCSNALAERGRATPDAVFILLDDVGHMNDSCHKSSIAWFCIGPLVLDLFCWTLDVRLIQLPVQQDDPTRRNRPLPRLQRSVDRRFDHEYQRRTDPGDQRHSGHKSTRVTETVDRHVTVPRIRWERR